MKSSKAKSTLSLLSFNTFGVPFFAPDLKKRYVALSEEIHKHTFDVLCLQELFSYYNVSFLKKLLPQFPYLIYAKSPVGPKGGLVLFSKYPLSQMEFIPFSYPQNAIVPFYARIAQHGVLSAVLTDFNLRIATTHLSSDTEHKLTAKDRLYPLIKRQSEETAAIINNYSKTNSNIILTGDFNIAKQSELSRAFFKKTKFVDLFSQDKEPTYYPERFKYIYIGNDASSIDNFMINPSAKITIQSKKQVFGHEVFLSNGKKSYLSDHNGLHCILRFNGS